MHLSLKMNIGVYVILSFKLKSLPSVSIAIYIYNTSYLNIYSFLLSHCYYFLSHNGMQHIFRTQCVQHLHDNVISVPHRTLLLAFLNRKRYATSL